MELLPQNEPPAGDKVPEEQPVVQVEQPASKTNSYAAKKSVAQRMMDIALLTSNANQLRYIFRYGKESGTFHLALSLIALSLALQILVGLFLIFRTKKNNSIEDKERANNVVVGGVFLITIVNILASAFAVDDDSPPIISSAIGPRLGNITEP